MNNKTKLYSVLLKLKRWTKFSHFARLEDRRMARVQLGMIVLFWLFGLLALLVNQVSWQNGFLVNIILWGYLLHLLPFALLIQKRLTLSSFFLVGLYTALAVSIATIGGGLHDYVVMLLPIIIMFAGLIAQQRGLVFACLMSLGGIAWLVLGEMYGWFVVTASHIPDWTDFFIASLLIVALAGMVRWLITSNQYGLTQTWRELDERKRLEAELRKLSQAVEQSPVSIMITNLDGIIEYINPRFSEVTGYGVNEVLGKTPNILQSSQTSQTVYRQLWENLNVGKEWHGEFINQRKDGTRYHESAVIAPITDKSGKATHYLSIQIDITEKVETQQILQESEARYRRLLDGLPAIIYTFSSKHGSVFMSPYVEQVLGYSREYLLEHPFLWNEAIHPEDRPRVQKAIESLAAGQNFDLEYRIQVKSGEWRWMMDRSIGYRVENDEILIEGLAADITERKTVELALQESEARFRSLVNSLSDVIYTLDLEERHTGVFGSWIEKSGSSPDFFVGKHAREIMGAQAAEVHEAANQRALTGQATAYEWSVAGEQGEQHYHTVVSPMLDESSQVIGLVGVGRDITKLKQAEQALQAKTQELEAFFDTNLDLLCIADSDGFFRRLNRQWETTLGYSLSELEGKRFLDFVHPDDRLATTAAFAQLNAQESILAFENRYCCKDGSYRWIEWRAVHYGKTIYAAARDITERKQIEQTLRESNARQQALFDHARDAILIADPQTGLILDANSQAEHLFGLSRAALIGKHQTELHPPRNKALSTSNFEEHAGGVEKLFEDEIVTVDGKIIPVEVNASLISLPKGKTVLQGIFRNIIIRKQMEDSIRRSRNMLHQVLDTIPQRVFWKDTSGYYLGCNQSFANSVGLDHPSQVLGKTDFDLTPSPRLAEAYRATDRKVLENDQAIVHEVEHYQDANGDHQWLDVTKIPLRNENGEAFAVLGVLEDITERNRAEESQKELLQRFELIAAHVPGVIYQYHLRPDGTSHFPYASAGIQNIYGVLPADVEQDATAVFQTLHPEDLAQVSASIQQSAQTMTSWHDVYRVNLPAGQTIWVEGNSTPLKLSDESILWHGYIQDVTERKRIEKALIESEHRFHAMFERHGAVMLLIEPESGSIIDANIAAQKFYGYSLEEFLHLRIQDINILSEVEVAEKRAQALLENINYFVFPHRLATGELRIVEVHSSPITIDTKTFLFSIIHDITERQQAEKALRERESLLRIAGQTAQFGGWNVDLATQKVTWSEQVALIHEKEPGYSPNFNEAILFYAPEWRDKLTRVFNACAQDGTPYDEEMEIITAHGRRIWVRTIGDATRDASGEIVGLQGSIQDITERKNSEQNIQFAYDSTLKGWSAALELREHETAGHSQRVVDITLALAHKLGIEAENMVHIQRGALLHDIGKMGIPDSILLKPGPLSDDEWVTMRQHPEFAYRMLSNIDYLKPALEIPYCHHEKWDGSGYPRGLKGEEIPLAARIFSVVDAWDALSHDRPYRPAWPHNEVIDYLRKQSGKQYDPQVVEYFIELILSDDNQ